MGRLGIVLGSAASLPGGADVAGACEERGAIVVRRHGEGDSYVLPHRVDHAANLRTLAEAGCDRVLGVCSVGSLRTDLGVGTLVCPDDFIALQVALTTFEDPRGHATPGFDAEWRRRVLRAWGPELRDGGVYWQTNGPRFETPAEVRLIAAHADVVGMTLASECIVAGELGLRHAGVCVVDNLANGIGERPLTAREVERHREASAAALREALGAALRELA